MIDDYERDLARWRNQSKEEELNGCSDAPNINDYTVVDRFVDPYLVKMYGRSYAEENAIKGPIRIKKSKLNE